MRTGLCGETTLRTPTGPSGGRFSRLACAFLGISVVFYHVARADVIEDARLASGLNEQDVVMVRDLMNRDHVRGCLDGEAQVSPYHWAQTMIGTDLVKQRIIYHYDQSGRLASLRGRNDPTEAYRRQDLSEAL